MTAAGRLMFSLSQEVLEAGRAFLVAISDPTMGIADSLQEITCSGGERRAS